MLCKSEGGLKDLQNFVKKSNNDYFIETKYDGERTQVIYFFNNKKDTLRWRKN